MYLYPTVTSGPVVIYAAYRFELLAFLIHMGLACVWMMDVLLAILLLRFVLPSDNFSYHSITVLTDSLSFLTNGYLAGHPQTTSDRLW